MVGITYRNLCAQISAGHVEQPIEALADLDRLWMGRSVHWMTSTATHPDDDDWLTDEETARWVGCRPQTVRMWGTRARRGEDGVMPVKGRFRWGDVQAYRQRQNQRRQGKSHG